MNTVNYWWEDMPHERYWLGVFHAGQAKDVLEVPDEDRKDVASWVSNLPAFLPPRDVIFHYDPSARAISAWSRARGSAQRREPGWSWGGAFERKSHHRSRWVIKLQDRKSLESPISADEIARVQWNLFPALRALEDRVGDPLYYPFALGSPEETHALPGRVFKLPALFVESFPALSAVAEATNRSGARRPPRRRAPAWSDALETILGDHPRVASRAR